MSTSKTWAANLLELSGAVDVGFTSKPALCLHQFRWGYGFSFQGRGRFRRWEMETVKEIWHQCVEAGVRAVWMERQTDRWKRIKGVNRDDSKIICKDKSRGQCWCRTRAMLVSYSGNVGAVLGDFLCLYLEIVCVCTRKLFVSVLGECLCLYSDYASVVLGDCMCLYLENVCVCTRTMLVSYSEIVCVCTWRMFVSVLGQC
ncbi:hypothetical protein Btru_018985 [Bulinus truncatus]|nr:hypothetical protein Btru_018985 [Bulinus truncatus]